ncbi:zinc-ribbon domain-containing protein [Pseudomonas sp. CDFA 602]|uniref:DUF3426 domain-containing protein n=1 Tax=Pseudomonas californiensis TaxID=2829823 RepID=UPI001E299061|nr:DUF3426 domain-containing protein [Pseudomonas californiensis]MCD5994335.1 zinc-ribbon domain-containing protein [Pseudomonas californiensis]MCD5999957.1 zinc-ribbon domain-containing protein [Pseudomonas californiensis]
MTDSFVTQCPHCQTSFRVSHAQLSVARGVVRCGACLQVFNAARQLLEQRATEETSQAPLQTGSSAAEPIEVMPPTAAPAADVIHQAPAQIVPPVAPLPVAHTAPEPKPLPSPAPKAEEDDPWQVSELDLDNMDLDEELARLERRETRQPERFGRPHTASHTGEDSLSARRDTAQTDEAAWVDTLHNDDVNHLPELQAEVIDDPEPIHDDLENPSDNDRTEPSLSLISEPVDDEPMAPTISSRKPLTTEKVERWSAVDDEPDEDDEPEPEPRGKRARNEPAVRDQALLDLTDDPLQLDWQRPKPRWGRRLVWGLLVLIALAGLATQYIWYHFDQLARQDQYRPLFQQVCPQIGCKVPSKVEISLLRSSNLVVRSHPEFQGALVVDAIIYNRAPFSQPFPLLELRFADTSGQLIASRRFKPSEYLSGEMAGKEEMPPQTPIHIALDILDPGAKAVNYSLNFRSPE